MHLLNLARVLKLLVLALTCPWSKVGQICFALHRSKWFASPGPGVLRGECCRIPRVSSCQRHHCCEFVVSFQHKKGKRYILILLFWFDSRLFLARSDVWWQITYRAQYRCREAATEGGSLTEESLPIHSADCDFLKDSIIKSITSFLRFLGIFVSSFHLLCRIPNFGMMPCFLLSWNGNMCQLWSCWRSMASKATWKIGRTKGSPIWFQGLHFTN